MNRSAVSNIIKLKLNDVPILSARKTAKQQTIKALSTKSHASLENNQSFYPIAEFFVRFTTFSERKNSLQEEPDRS